LNTSTASARTSLRTFDVHWMCAGLRRMLKTKGRMCVCLQSHSKYTSRRSAPWLAKRRVVGEPTWVVTVVIIIVIIIIIEVLQIHDRRLVIIQHRIRRRRARKARGRCLTGGVPTVHGVIGPIAVTTGCSACSRTISVNTVAGCGCSCVGCRRDVHDGVKRLHRAVGVGAGTAVVRHRFVCDRPRTHAWQLCEGWSASMHLHPATMHCVSVTGNPNRMYTRREHEAGSHLVFFHDSEEGNLPSLVLLPVVLGL